LLIAGLPPACNVVDGTTRAAVHVQGKVGAERFAGVAALLNMSPAELLKMFPALALGVTLVTTNPADFQAYPGLCLENWVAQSNAP
jgi:hypothetical protein